MVNPVRNYRNRQEKIRSSVRLRRDKSSEISNGVNSLRVIEEPLRERGARFKKELTRVKKELNADALHDLRVSIRRLNAVFSLLSLFPQTKIKKAIRKKPRSIMKLLGELRDLHVEVEIINAVFQRKNQFVRSFLDKLNKALEQKEGNIRRVVKSFSPDFLKKLNIKKTILPLLGTDWEYQAKIALAALFKNFSSFAEKAQGGNIDAFHRMRISLKKLRYTSEILLPLFPWITEVRLNNMHTLQQVMGDIHDRDLLIQKMKDEEVGNRNLIRGQEIAVRRLNERRKSLFDEGFKEYLLVVLSYERDFAVLPEINDEMALQAAFLLLLKDIKNKKEGNKVKNALLYGKNIHIVHPLRTALILAEELEIRDADVVTAALLHDTLEAKGTVATREKIEKNFGKRVALLVWNLTKEDWESKNMESYLQKVRSSGELTKIIKLADRLDSTRHLNSKSKKKQRVYWKSTLEDFAPIFKELTPPYRQFFEQEYKRLWEETAPEVRKGLVLNFEKDGGRHEKGNIEEEKQRT